MHVFIITDSMLEVDVGHWRITVSVFAWYMTGNCLVSLTHLSEQGIKNASSAFEIICNIIIFATLNIFMLIFFCHYYILKVIRAALI